jgi:hypothetical protein
MKYRVVKIPMPDRTLDLEQLINQSAPPGHELIALTLDSDELILVFRETES